MLMILYNGDVNANYYVGWRDSIDAKAAYLMSLVNIGIASHSTYLTIQTKNQDAWKVVQSGYTDQMKMAVDRIKKTSVSCDTNKFKTAEINVKRVVDFNKGITN